MWTWEDIELMNPPTTGQSRPLLHYLLNIGAVAPDLLCEGAETLESLEYPHILTFGLLPCVLSTGDDTFSLSGWGINVPSVELRFRTVTLTMEAGGSIKQTNAKDRNSINEKNVIANATLVLGLIALWGKRRILYDNYKTSITPSGLQDRNIGERKPWMELPKDASTGPLSAKAFENELTIRVRKEVVYALDGFLRAYGMAQMENIYTKAYLYSYFAMTHPGRISAGGIPVPLYFSLRNFIPNYANVELDRDKFSKCQRSSGQKDRIVRQLLAMSRLIKEGEPELAIVGSVSSMEWFLNTKFPEFIHKGKNNKEYKASLAQCLTKSPLNKILDEKIKNKLYKLVEIRNSIVHGEPPIRENYSSAPTLEAFARFSLELCFQVYRLINLSTPVKSAQH
jgi:hypothetical protein